MRHTYAFPLDEGRQQFTQQFLGRWITQTSDDHKETSYFVPVQSQIKVYYSEGKEPVTGVYCRDRFKTS